MFVIAPNQFHTWTLRQETNSIRNWANEISLTIFFLNGNQATALGDYEKYIYRTSIS